jgi:hypothetical protein
VKTGTKYLALAALGLLATTVIRRTHTRDTAQHKALPLGIAKLMMSFTEEGQLDPALLAERDRLLGISSAQNRERRAKLVDEPVPDGADTWQQGDVVQVQLAQTGMSFRESD